MIVPRSLVLALVFLLLGAGAASARGDAPVCAASCKAAPAGSGALLVLSGHGWGHGVGMSQYGAYGYAQHGWTYQRILTHYYPGTTLGPAPRSSVRILVASQKTVTIGSTTPWSVRDATGTKLPLEVGTVTLGPALTIDGTTLQPPLRFADDPLRNGAVVIIAIDDRRDQIGIKDDDVTRIDGENVFSSNLSARDRIDIRNC